MKSKFKYRVCLILILIIFILFLILKITFSNELHSEDYMFKIVFLNSILIFTFIWLFFGELRTKIISLKILNNSIIKRTYLGLGKGKEFNIDYFDFYVTSDLPSRSGTYEYTYLMKDNKKIIKISEFYHKNYFNLKDKINSKIKFEGKIDFSYIDDVKEIFE